MLLTFGKRAIKFHRINVGDYVWKNKDPLLDIKLKDYVEKSNNGLIDVSVSVSGNINEPLVIKIKVIDDSKLNKDLDIHESQDLSEIGYAATKSLLCEAVKNSLKKDDIAKAIGSLGGSPYKLSPQSKLDSNSAQKNGYKNAIAAGTDDKIDIDVSGLGSNLFVPVSEIKAARREAVEDLIEKRRKHNIYDNFNYDIDLLAQLRKDTTILASLENSDDFEENMESSMSVKIDEESRKSAISSEYSYYNTMTLFVLFD